MKNKRNHKSLQVICTIILLAVICFTGYSTAFADESGVTVASFNYTTGEYSQFKSQYNVVSSFNKYYNNDLFSYYGSNYMMILNGPDNGTYSSSYYLSKYGDQRNSVYVDDPISVSEDYSFSCAFSFSMSGYNNGTVNSTRAPKIGDGFAFIMHSGDSVFYGTSGSGLGYYSDSNALGVEFDVYKSSSSYGDSAAYNWGNISLSSLVPIGKYYTGTSKSFNNNGYVYTNHVAIAPGSTTALADGHSFSNPYAFKEITDFQFYGGHTFASAARRYVWIDYNGATQSMEVRISTTTIRPEDPTTEGTVDLASILGEDNVHVGFTAGSGSAFTKIIIHDWHFVNVYKGLAKVDMDTTYSISYNLNGGTNPSGAATAYSPGAGVTLPTPAKSGFIFKGWYDNEALSGTAVTSISTEENGNKTYWARWQEEGTYCISYSGNDNDGGTVPSDNTSYHNGDTVTILSDEPTKKGYTFSGWSDGTNTYDAGDTFNMPESDMTLTAVWTVADYALTYDGDGNDGGSLPVGPTDYHYEDEVTVSSAKPTKTGYTFSGWSDGTNTYDAGDTFTMPANNVTLTAQWTAIDYTVSYNGNDNTGGTVPSDLTNCHYEDELTISSDTPTKIGCTFSGWSDGSNTYDAGDTLTMPANDVTLAAQWTAIDYTVSYDGNDNTGGTVPSDLTTCHYEDELTISSDAPTKIGYTFSGWSDGTNTYDAGATLTMPTNDVTLTAQWSINSYKIMFEESGGSIVKDITCKYNTILNALESSDPSRDYYTFGGWYLVKDLTKKVSFPYTVEDNTTWYAKWNEIPVESVWINKTAATLYAGDTIALTASIKPANATNPEITWTSSNENIVYVDQNGKVSAKKAGKATITAKAGEKSATCLVTVKSVDSSSDYAPTQSSSPEVSTSAPKPSNDIASPSQTPSPTKNITILPESVKEDTDNGTYIIEINADDLPAGTTSIKTADGQIIHLDGSDTFKIVINTSKVNKDGIIEISALNSSNTSLGIYDVQVLQKEDSTVSSYVTDSIMNAFISVFLWIIAAILILFLIIKKKRKSGEDDQ